MECLISQNPGNVRGRLQSFRGQVGMFCVGRVSLLVAARTKSGVLVASIRFERFQARATEADFLPHPFPVQAFLAAAMADLPPLGIQCINRLFPVRPATQILRHAAQGKPDLPLNGGLPWCRHVTFGQL